MADKKLKQLADFGQSIWLDYISRPLMESGQLKKMIDGGLRGMTSNPSIFNNAIGSSNDYDEEIIRLKQAGKSTFDIYDELTIKDIQSAADAFKDVYEKTNKLDGYVSLEINPLLANKFEEQIEEGKRLFKAVNRPNVMIKVPSTEEGFVVFEELIASGINVNVTLIFSLAQYEKTAQAYFKGLRRLTESTSDLSGIRSVASVFISRIDTAVDKLIEERLVKNEDQQKKNELEALKGTAAVANSRIIFEKYKEIFNGDEFKSLETQQAPHQRVLWGSTGTKNPQYSDIKYLTELIAKPTVNTLPEKTIDAFIDHGEIKDGFEVDAGTAFEIIEKLKSNDIDVDAVCAKLLKDGCDAFNQAFESLLESVEKKSESLIKSS